jgi:hypothetical protein
MAEVAELDGRDMTAQHRHKHAAAVFVKAEVRECT